MSQEVRYAPCTFYTHTPCLITGPLRLEQTHPPPPPVTRGATNSADQCTTLSVAIRNENPDTIRAHTTQANPPVKKKHMRANINVMTLNINGLTAPASGMTFLEKWSMVNQTLNKHKIAVLALQETHLD